MESWPVAPCHWPGSSGRAQHLPVQLIRASTRRELGLLPLTPLLHLHLPLLLLPLVLMLLPLLLPLPLTPLLPLPLLLLLLPLMLMLLPLLLPLPRILLLLLRLPTAWDRVLQWRTPMWRHHHHPGRGHHRHRCRLAHGCRRCLLPLSMHLLLPLPLPLLLRMPVLLLLLLLLILLLPVLLRSATPRGRVLQQRPSAWLRRHHRRGHYRRHRCHCCWGQREPRPSSRARSPAPMSHARGTYLKGSWTGAAGTRSWMFGLE